MAAKPLLLALAFLAALLVVPAPASATCYPEQTCLVELGDNFVCVGYNPFQVLLYVCDGYLGYDGYQNKACAVVACVGVYAPEAGKECVDTEAYFVDDQVACARNCFLPVLDNGVACAQENAATVQGLAAPYTDLVESTVGGLVDFVTCDVLGGPFCPGPL